MSDKAIMLRETAEAFAHLRMMLDGLTEEQASRIRLGVLGVRDLVVHWQGLLRGCADQMSPTAEAIHDARMFWAPGSFWALRYPCERNGA